MSNKSEKTPTTSLLWAGIYVLSCVEVLERDAPTARSWGGGLQNRGVIRD